MNLHSYVNVESASVDFDGGWAAAAMMSVDQGCYGVSTLKMSAGRYTLDHLMALGRKTNEADQMTLLLAGGCYTALLEADHDKDLDNIVDAMGDFMISSDVVTPAAKARLDAVLDANGRAATGDYVLIGMLADIPEAEQTGKFKQACRTIQLAFQEPMKGINARIAGA